MSTRRSLFTFGALLAAVALLLPAAALAQQKQEELAVEPTIGPADPASYNKLEVAWELPTVANRLDGYRVYYAKGTDVINRLARNADGYVDVDGGSKAKVTLEGLEDNTAYVASVATITEDDDGAVASIGDLVDTQGTAVPATGSPGTSYMTELAPMPSTPRNVVAMGGDETFTLSWDAPYAGGSDLTIKEYRVQKREVAGNLIGDWIPNPSTGDDKGGKKVDPAMTTITFEDLENGVSYEGRVMATNSAGRPGDWTTRTGDDPDDDATAMVGGDDMDDEEDEEEEAPALPLVGLGFLGAMLAGRGAWLRRRNA